MLLNMENEKDKFLSISIMAAALIIAGAWIYTGSQKPNITEAADAKILANLERAVLPAKGVKLPVVWGDLGQQMTSMGVIDRAKFEALYNQRGGLDSTIQKLLIGSDNDQLLITKENSSILLNLFWAFGLANKNVILEKGPMADKQYGGAGNFASTGGWTLAVGSPMSHYSRHVFISLTPEQQALVEKVSQNIYRPCCGNSTYFPDCNHGMAMLGLLELMAAQGVSENEMYQAALAINSFWFPDTYLNIAQYLKAKGISWEKAGAKEILGANFSSAQGYRQVLNQIQPTADKKGAACGV